MASMQPAVRLGTNCNRGSGGPQRPSAAWATASTHTQPCHHHVCIHQTIAPRGYRRARPGTYPPTSSSTAATSRQHSSLQPCSTSRRPRHVVCAAVPAVPEAASLAGGLPDAATAVLAAAGAFIWVKIFDKLASAGFLDQKLSRKLVHSTAGPLFVLTWPFFSDAPTARLLAAAVPCLNMLRLLAVGSGVVPDPGLVKSVSRDGDRTELLKGPLYYVVVLVSATLVFWRTNPAGLIAISMMCGGDGLADIVGRRLGSSKLPWNSAKSWAGSAAMFVGGMAMAAGFVALYCHLGYFECLQVTIMAPYIAAVCLACTLVESLPINQWVDDNISVPGVAVLGSMLLLPYAAAAAAQAGCPVEMPPPLLLLPGLGS